MPGQRRMLALALVKEGHPRAEAARLCGMDRQTLRDWVHRYNEAGIAGLADKQGRTGPKPRLSAEQEAEVAELVRSGPDVAKDGIVRWRRVDLAQVIEDRFRRGGPRFSDRWLSLVRLTRRTDPMTGKRKRYGVGFKSRVSLEALRSELTTAQLAAKHGVHQTMVGEWKRQAMDGLASVFSGKEAAQDTARLSEAEVEKLHAKIGQLVVERDFLAKASGR